MALTHTPDAEIGMPCPDFDLPATNGQRVTRAQFLNDRPFLIMFICNHCPYVKAIEDRLITLGHDLKELGVGVVAISANDAKDYPEDSFEKMRERANEKNYSFAYAHDETQEVARAFGAVCTPDYFMYDGEGRLAYRGRLDDSWKEPAKVTKRELFEAAKLLAAGEDPPREQVPSMGCSIKWSK